MNNHNMIYEFRLILKGVDDISEELADALFEAGCDDSTPGVFCGVPHVDFDRDAESLESAIRSAIADVQKAGCVVERVEIGSGAFSDSAVN
jgi:hypothetical protein